MSIDGHFVQIHNRAEGQTSINRSGRLYCSIVARRAVGSIAKQCRECYNAETVSGPFGAVEISGAHESFWLVDCLKLEIRWRPAGIKGGTPALQWLRRDVCTAQMASERWDGGDARGKGEAEVGVGVSRSRR